MRLVTLTSAHTGKQIVIEVELIGEVADLTGNLCQQHGKTKITYVSNRRVKWTVNEPFGEVMRRIAPRKG